MDLKNKITPIDYTSRDFESIKADLVAYAKRYYSNTFQDFNQASFGSLMLDTVAYVGDILSFYVDYQANESLLETANQYNSILRIGRQLGYKFNSSATAYGTVALYVTVPALSSGGGPDPQYIPIVEKGTVFSSVNNQSFALNENVDFSNPENEVVCSDCSTTTGIPTFYAIRAFGQVLSGELRFDSVEVGSYRRFQQVALNDPNISEVLSVIDSEGNQYYEVDHLSQNVIFAEVDNTGLYTDTVPSLLKPILVPRRFVRERKLNRTVLQFGYGSEENLNTVTIPDPSDLTLDIHGRNYTSQASFDPSKMTKTDALGVAPANTILTVMYRSTPLGSVNASVGTVSMVVKRTMRYPKMGTGIVFDTTKITNVNKSLEVSNLEPIVGEVSFPSTIELKTRILGHFATQNRAVTKQDYLSLIYSMPAQFGSVRRAQIVQDPDSFKRNINVYVISEDSSGKLAATNSVIKTNLKSWIQKHKMINDTVDILNAYVLNLEVDFTAVATRGSNRYEVHQAAIEFLSSYFSIKKFDIGENFYISDIFSVLRGVPGILDVVEVSISAKNQVGYSAPPINIDNRRDPDGRYINIPKNVIVEVKWPNQDIVGTIR